MLSRGEKDREFRYALMGLLGFRELLERFAKLEERQQKLEEELVRVRRPAELNRRDIGVLREAIYSRWVWEDLKELLKERGEAAVVGRRRSARIDKVDVDMLVETGKSIYVVEVKIQPNRHDVAGLLVKAEFVGKRLGKPARPVLAGTWIGGEVKRYAGEKGVEVLEY